MTKTCSKCGEVKELDCFYKDKTYTLGVRGKCIECSRLQNNKWKEDNAEHCLEYSRRQSLINKNKPNNLKQIIITKMENLQQPSSLVKSSMDYDLFELAPNKPLNRFHVERLKKEISLNDLGQHYPIQCTLLVNGKLLLTNGQHRRTARMELGLPIYYEISGLSLQEERRAENLTLKWNKSDIVHYFTIQGNDNYKRIKMLEDRTGWKVGTFSNVISFVKNSTVFDNGGLQFSDKDYSDLLRTIELSISIEPMILFVIQRKMLLLAVRHIMANKKIETSKLLLKINKYNELILPKMTVDGYLEAFEKVYNYRSHSEHVSFKRTSKGNHV